MGTDDASISRGNDVLGTSSDARANGIVFLKNGGNMAAYWMDTVKGVGSVELGYCCQTSALKHSMLLLRLCPKRLWRTCWQPMAVVLVAVAVRHG